MISIRYEQAVYGSFPFWDKGYAILARSPGCRDEWLADLRAACQRFGERPPGAVDAAALLAIRLPSGPWAVVGVSPQGRDDRGRPGAVAFHALFLSGGDYRKIGAFPFDLGRLHRTDWTADTTLTAGTFTPDAIPPAEGTPADDPHASRVAAALARGRRVALESPGPIDDLARRVWPALPLRRRARLGLATWTYSLGNRPDLAALPRLAGVTLDKSYIDPDTSSRQGPRLAIAPAVATIPLAGRAAWLAFAAVALSALGLAWRTGDATTDRGPRLAQSGTTGLVPPIPDASTAPLPPGVREQAVEGLVAFSKRFGTLDPASSAANLDPDALMMRLRERLTYSGPLLTPPDLSRLASSPDPDRDRILTWHSHISLFLPDRPLPPDFPHAPLAWQLRILARSFHLDASALPPEAIPRLLSDSLTLPASPRSTPLADRYPALGDYARFLRRLPSR